LKVLPSAFTNDAERIARFRLEAKAVSAQNHPNIVTIYEIAPLDETWFIAEELIEGITLPACQYQTQKGFLSTCLLRDTYPGHSRLKRS
jgi:hypothetical protein